MKVYRREALIAGGASRRAPRGSRRDHTKDVALARLLARRALGPAQAMAGLDAAGRARLVNHLQRTAGNAAVQRLLAVPAVQREQILYDAKRALTWKDYQGAVPKQSGLDALTHTGRTGLKVGWDVVKDGKQWTATSKIDPGSLNLRAFVDTSRSWAKRAQTSAALLRHEQGHFDIQNVLVEKGEVVVRAAAKDVTGTGTAPKQKDAIDMAVADLKQSLPFAKIDALDSVIDTVHTDYDEDPVKGTDHGTKTAEQAQWQADIAKGLPGYPIR